MVASYTQLLARRYKDKLDQDANEFIEFAADGAVRMQQMIRDLLEYSRAGRKGNPFEPANCETILQNALSNLETAIKESGAAVTHDPLPTVMADAPQLARLFQNLVGNGLKYRAKEAPRVHVSASRKNREWVFSVRDNGIGIEAAHHERVFTIFQRLHTAREYPGTGIGLSVSKKIVEYHKGRIWVESELGKGSTFYFTIPVMEPAQEGKDGNRSAN